MSKESLKSDIMVLYKTAAAGMAKKALDLDGVKNSISNVKLSDNAKFALMSALGGAGVGLAAHMITPKDEDEDTRGRLLTNILTGAALGGIAGYGGKTLFDAAKGSGLSPVPAPKKKSWWQRNAPEVGYSDLMIGGGLGTGAVAGGAALNAMRAGRGLERLGAQSASAEGVIRNIMTDAGKWNEKAIAGNPALAKVRQAFNQAKHPGFRNRLKQLIPDVRGVPGSWRSVGTAARTAQRDADRALFKAIEAAGKGGKATPAAMEALLKSKLSNPRAILQARQLKRLPKGKLGAIAAALLLAGGGYKLYEGGQRK